MHKNKKETDYEKDTCIFAPLSFFDDSCGV